MQDAPARVATCFRKSRRDECKAASSERREVELPNNFISINHKHFIWVPLLAPMTIDYTKRNFRCYFFRPACQFSITVNGACPSGARKR